jgi:hypothetical protein
MRIGTSSILMLAAVAIFLLAAFGVGVGGISLVPLGLACFAAGHLL